MVEYLYEKDLRGMQYNILISTRHDWTVTEIARRYGIGKQRLRKLLVERLDMILLENLPARYEAWLARGDPEGAVERRLGQELLTRYIPLLDPAAMQYIVSETKGSMANGLSEDLAVESGIGRVREVLFT